MGEGQGNKISETVIPDGQQSEQNILGNPSLSNQIGRSQVVNGQVITTEQWGEFMPETLEKQRLAWMRDCKPWRYGIIQ